MYYKKAAILFLILSLALFTGCNQTKVDKAGSKADMPQDFAFILKYGIGAKNVLDTFKGTFTKDLISAGEITTDLKLTDEEKEKIYNEMRKIDIFTYPENFKPRSNEGHEPHQSYYFKVQMNGRVKEIFWDEEFVAKSPEALRLRALIIQITDIVHEKEEFKKLPKPTGGYM